jgi:hypothetical protein
MRTRIRRLGFFVLAVLAGSLCFADGLMITINNGTTQSLLVTVYDTRPRTPVKILSSTIINGNASITVSISSDSTGRGKLRWTATTVDRDMRSCGRGDKAGLNDGDSVDVSADSACSGQ